MRPSCKFDHVMEGNMAKAMEQEQQAACCPTVKNGFLSAFAGSAYPEAFRCITNVGCTESTIMSQLVEECHGLCDYIPRLMTTPLWPHTVLGQFAWRITLLHLGQCHYP